MEYEQGWVKFFSKINKREWGGGGESFDTRKYV